MNCDLCQKHILATMQIYWNGGNYHPDCIGEAVARKRAEHEQSLEVDPNEIEELEENQVFNEDFAGYEEGDDLEDLIERLDEVEVSDEILNEIPISATNGENGGVHNPIVLPPGAMIAAPRAIIHPPVNGNLMVHCGAQKIERADLAALPVPEATATFKPIAHSTLVDVIEEALAFRHIRIVGQEFATSPDGMKLFAVLRVNADYEGVGFAIGLRNANDRSMRVGIVSGYKVFCCDNLAFSGDFNPMLQKHSKNLDLVESVSIAIDRIQRQWQPLRTAIDFKRNHELEEDDARKMIYRLFTDYKLPNLAFHF